MKNYYQRDFYENRHQQTVYSANTILPIVLDALPVVHSAVDFGCAVGTWLAVLKEQGVDDIQGLDGDWVEQDLLEISKENFRQVDLEKKIKLDKKYDLAISLEVAEHLQPAAANRFVESLTEASDFVFFSAAIPKQGGENHINEQWQDYWADLFKERGCVVLDIVRHKIWNEEKIPVHHRQNCLLFVKREQVTKLRMPIPSVYDENFPISIVHPHAYFAKIIPHTVRGSWKLFRRAVKHWVRIRMSKNR